MSLNIATLLAESAARDPRGLALRSDHEEVSYGELWRRVRRLAFALRTLGLRPGQKIEEHLYAHPAVIEAAVVGVPDERYGEEIHGFVALRTGSVCSEDELVAYCRERLAAYKYPRRVTVLVELPKGPTGKILKRLLRSPASAST